MSTKRYYWLKQHSNFFQHLKIKKLRSIVGGDTYTIIFQQIMLMSITADGIIQHEGVEETIEEELALVLNETIDNIRITFAYMLSNGLIEKITENEYLLPDVPRLIGSESSSAERVRRHRERKSMELQCNTHVIQMKQVSNIEKEKELNKKISLKNESFFNFKKRIINLYAGLPLIIGPNGYLSDTVISLSSSGFLHNTVSGKDLTVDDAQKLWAWLFKNQTCIIKKG